MTLERLYHEQADAIVAQGFLSVGYNAIHMDDCWSVARMDDWWYSTHFHFCNLSIKGA